MGNFLINDKNIFKNQLYQVNINELAYIIINLIRLYTFYMLPWNSIYDGGEQRMYDRWSSQNERNHKTTSLAPEMNLYLMAEPQKLIIFFHNHTINLILWIQIYVIFSFQFKKYI